MQKTDLKKFAELMTALASVKNRPCDEAMLLGYKIGLEDLPIERVENAIHRAIREHDGMPDVTTLRRFAGAPQDKDAALLAWEVVIHQGGPIGTYKHVDFQDKIINATIRTLGGWPQFMDRCVGDEEKWARKDFLETYRALAAMGVNGEICRPLPGLSTGAVMSDGSIGKPIPIVIESTPAALPKPRRTEIAQQRDEPKRLTADIKQDNPAAVDLASVLTRANK